MKKVLLILFISCYFFIACEEDTIYTDNDGPEPKTQSDFIGTWETDYVTADITFNKFGFINKARIPNIVFEMNITNWENVPCEVTFVREINGRDVPDEDFSRSWREGKTTYKITGVVTSNNSPDNALAKIGSTQSIYLHHSGYRALFIGFTRTDTGSDYFFKK